MNKVYLDKYVILNNKVNKNILVISDIHYWSKDDQFKLNKILDFIKDKKYDFIAIPGDFINDSMLNDEEILLDFFEKLGHFGKVIISLGNHDTMILKKNRMYYKNEKLFEKINNIKNVHLLDNDYFESSHIRFIGVTLPHDYYRYHENKNYFMRYLNNVYDEVPKNMYNICLCHSPYSVDDDISSIKLFKNTNLIISGHMHAGLAPRFLREKLKGSGFVTPFRKLFAKRCYGMYDVLDKKLVISAGVTKFSKNTIFRFFDKLYDIELVEIELKK